MLNVEEFRTLVVRPTIAGLDMHSQAAENLLVGTAVQESGLRHLIQRGGGPALGLYQMEPATYRDIFDYIERKGQTFINRIFLGAGAQSYERYSMESFRSGRETPMDMTWNLRFATVMARVHYWRVSEPLPDADDIEGLGRYWKQYYNTPQGHGTVDQFVENYQTHVL